MQDGTAEVRPEGRRPADETGAESTVQSGLKQTEPITTNKQKGRKKVKDEAAPPAVREAEVRRAPAPTRRADKEGKGRGQTRGA